MRTTAIAPLAAALFGLVGCTSDIAATPGPNPIDLCRKAGAEPDMENATKGLKLDIGGWLGSCRFAEQASQGNASLGAFTQLSVYTYDNRKQLEEALSTNPNATTVDGHKVIVGNDQNFYAVVTGLADGTFDVKPEDVAASLNGSLRPKLHPNRLGLPGHNRVHLSQELRSLAAHLGSSLRIITKSQLPATHHSSSGL